MLLALFSARYKKERDVDPLSAQISYPHADSSYAQYSEANAQDRALHYSVLLKFLNWRENYLAANNYEDATVRALVLKRKAYATRNLGLVQNPVLGPLVISLLRFIEWSLDCSRGSGGMRYPHLFVTGCGPELERKST